MSSLVQPTYKSMFFIIEKKWMAVTFAIELL